MGRPKHAARARFERVFLARVPGVVVALMGALQVTTIHTSTTAKSCSGLFIVIKLTGRALVLAEYEVD